MTDLQTTLCRIREKLGWLRAIDGGGLASAPSSLASFGATRHLHELEPPIDPEALATFESLIGTRLPEEYRAFLLEMGNGGAGPYYGLLPLAVWETSEDPITDHPLDFDALEKWQEERRPTRAADPSRDFVLDGLFYPCEITETVRRNNYPPGGAHCFDGCVRLSDAGCGESCFLVVRGARMGEVWMDQSQAAWPVRPISKSFLVWYERWLDSALGNALAIEIRRGLVKGDSLDPRYLESIGPLVEAHGAEAASKTPLPQSDEDIWIREAKGALAYLRLAQGRFEEAAECVSGIYLALARDGIEAALAWIATATRQDADLVAIRARLLRRLGRDREAILALDEAIAAFPHDDDLPRHKAWIQIELGDRAGAEQALSFLARRYRRDREHAHDGADRVGEFAAALTGDDAERFAALAARLHAEADRIPERVRQDE